MSITNLSELVFIKMSCHAPTHFRVWENGRSAEISVGTHNSSYSDAVTYGRVLLTIGLTIDKTGESYSWRSSQ